MFRIGLGMFLTAIGLFFVFELFPAVENAYDALCAQNSGYGMPVRLWVLAAVVLMAVGFFWEPQPKRR